MSGLLADHDLESETGTGSVSVSSVTSPVSQSSYNPLLDELVQQASDDSAYMVMSPATSSGKDHLFSNNNTLFNFGWKKIKCYECTRKILLAEIEKNLNDLSHICMI